MTLACAHNQDTVPLNELSDGIANDFVNKATGNLQGKQTFIVFLE